jgi:hypothetical protein
VLLRLSCLALTNAFAFARLLRMSDVDKDVEILALRHQLAVMQRQVDRALLRCGISGRAELGRGRRQIATRRRTAATVADGCWTGKCGSCSATYGPPAFQQLSGSLPNVR